MKSKWKLVTDSFWLRLTVFIFLIWLVVYLTPPSKSTKVGILSNYGSYFLYVNTNYPERRANIFLNQMLGAALNLGWYDVCFFGEGNIDKNHKEADNTKLAINILPVDSNQSIVTIKQWIKNLLLTEPDHPLGDEVIDKLLTKIYFSGPDGTSLPDQDQAMPGILDKVVQTSIFSNLNGKPVCTPLSLNEHGFLYTGKIYVLEQNFNEVTKRYENQETLLLAKDSDPVHLMSADLEVKTNYYFLYAKRVALFLLIIGFIVSMWKILCFVFKRK